MTQPVDPSGARRYGGGVQTIVSNAMQWPLAQEKREIVARAVIYPGSVKSDHTRAMMLGLPWANPRFKT